MTGTTWAQQMDRLRTVPPAELAEVLCTDPQAAAEVQRTDGDLALARRAAVHRIVSAHAAAGDDPTTLTPEDVEVGREADPQVIAARTLNERAREAYEASLVEFFFRALPRPTYEALKAQHLPTDAERAAGKNVAASFAPVLISASHVFRVPTGTDGDGATTYTEHPGMTVDDATELLTTWSQGDAQMLYDAAKAVNESTRIDFVALGKASGPTTG